MPSRPHHRERLGVWEALSTWGPQASRKHKWKLCLQGQPQPRGDEEHAVQAHFTATLRTRAYERLFFWPLRTCTFGFLVWPQELSCGLVSSLQLPMVGFARQFQPDQGSWHWRHLMPLACPPGHSSGCGSELSGP